MNELIVVPARQHLLARRPQHDRVLVLRDVASLYVHERRVRLYDPVVAQIFQRHEILCLPDAI